MTWPNALIKELAGRRCIIFLGAGASAGCLSADGVTRPPTWSQFLEGLINIMNSDRDVHVISDLITKEKYLDAAEIILKDISVANYTDYLRATFQRPNFKPSKIHEAVLKIDPKIVVTTNFDEIYDNYCKAGTSRDGYNICNHNEDYLVSDLRSPIRCIIKAHGSISDVAKTVLTRSQFFNARKNYNNFYKVLDSLFVTNTLLFIGYSLNDPDIQLVLENSNIASVGSHPHYAVVQNNIHLSIKGAMTRAYNIEFIEHTAGDFTELQNGLDELANLVETYRLNYPM